jgi:hypothetical protein
VLLVLLRQPGKPEPVDRIEQGSPAVILRLGIDIAVRAPHQASLANERGELLWSGHRFRTSAKELEALWSKVQGMTAEAVTVVMEPTRNAWVPLAAWFRRREVSDSLCKCLVLNEGVHCDCGIEWEAGPRGA